MVMAGKEEILFINLTPFIPLGVLDAIAHPVGQWFEFQYFDHYTIPSKILGL
jgi:hypothetical protein